jgi:hypothetical protein
LARWKNQLLTDRFPDKFKRVVGTYFVAGVVSQSGCYVDVNLRVGGGRASRSLGRRLSTGPRQTAATCSQTATIALIPNNTLYPERIKQLDARFSRIFRFGETKKVQGNFDMYDIFNNNTVLNERRAAVSRIILGGT